MNKNKKIYLRLKQNIDIKVLEGGWTLETGDMIVLEKIGTKTSVVNNPYSGTKYNHRDCYMLSGVEYKTIKNLAEVVKGQPIEYYMKFEEYSSVDTIMSVGDNRDFIFSDLNDEKISLLFEDVSIKYNRDILLKEILE